MKGGGVIEYFWNSVSKLPIRRIDFSSVAEKAAHAKIVKLVNKMLAAKKAEAEAEGARRDHWIRQCEALDRQIDSMVYELYGLIEKEIARVEEAL